MEKQIALVIPTYNEADNIAPLLQKIRGICPDIPIYFIDSNSTDLTQDNIEKHQQKDRNVHLLRQPKKMGLGPAYTEALSHLTKNTSVTHVLCMDADLSHDPVEMPNFIEKSEKYDVVIGSRVVNSTLFQPENFFRNLISKCINFYTHKILRLPITDYSSGFILFPLYMLKNNLTKLEKTKGYIFQAHLKYALSKKTSNFIEIPIFFKNRVAGKSKLDFSIVLEALLKTHKIPSYYN